MFITLGIRRSVSRGWSIITVIKPTKQQKKNNTEKKPHLSKTCDLLHAPFVIPVSQFAQKLQQQAAISTPFLQSGNGCSD